MLAVKGHYKDGKITLLEPLPVSIHEAELNVVVLPVETDDQKYFPSQEYICRESTSEEDFKNLSLAVFFNDTDDANVDWEDCLGLK
ncbi:hypothetical protein ACTVJH_04880 [Desulfoplanes sp. PS50]|jgi:hypothetical protein